MRPLGKLLSQRVSLATRSGPIVMANAYERGAVMVDVQDVQRGALAHVAGPVPPAGAVVEQLRVDFDSVGVSGRNGSLGWSSSVVN